MLTTSPTARVSRQCFGDAVSTRTNVHTYADYPCTDCMLSIHITLYPYHTVPKLCCTHSPLKPTPHCTHTPLYPHPTVLTPHCTHSTLYSHPIVPTSAPTTPYQVPQTPTMRCYQHCGLRYVCQIFVHVSTAVDTYVQTSLVECCLHCCT